VSDDLLRRYLEGTLSAEEMKALQELLRRDPQAVRALFQEAKIDAALGEVFKTEDLGRKWARRAGSRARAWGLRAGLVAAAALVALAVLLFRSDPRPIETVLPAAPVDRKARVEAERKEVETRLAEIEVQKRILLEARRPAEPPRQRTAEEESRRALAGMELARVEVERKKIEEELSRVRADEAAPEPAPRPPRPGTVAAVAVVDRVHGEASAPPGKHLLSGEGLETRGPASWAVVRFPDATRLELWGDTGVRLSDEKGKRLSVEKGTVVLDVVKQPAERPLVLSTPQADVTVLGTQLRMVVSDQTLLETVKGRTRMTRTSDAKSVEVAAGHFAVASSGGGDLVARSLRVPKRGNYRKFPHPGVDAQKVDEAVSRAAEWLLDQPNAPPGARKDTAWRYDELSLLALLHAGLDPRHPHFQGLLRQVLEAPLERVYRVSLQAMLLGDLDPAAHRRRLAECGQFLVDNHCQNGQWNYGEAVDIPDFGEARITVRRRRTGPASGDNSNTQYAVLGLRACMEAGVGVPSETLASALKWWESTQNSDGGWAYHGTPDGAPQNRASVGSMTAGGIASVLILRRAENASVGRAWKWLADNFSIQQNPRIDPAWWSDIGPPYFIYLYALQRAGALTGRDRFGARDWYREGALHLLALQNKDGSWRQKDFGQIPLPVADTCFAILFLRRATSPLP